MIASAIGAADASNELASLLEPRVDARRHTPGSRAARSIARANSRSDAQIRRDATGAILNAEELSVAEVVKERVWCPACAGHVFEEWPYGWDAHAVKRRFSHLFR